jgi:hypothetical protein
MCMPRSKAVVAPVYPFSVTQQSRSVAAAVAELEEASAMVAQEQVQVASAPIP